MKQTIGFDKVLKSTFLFSFVQVINIGIKLVTNKIVASLIGVEGIGMMGIFNNTLTLMKTFGGLGISQSVVRDISHEGAKEKDLTLILFLLNKILLYSSFFGFVLTIILSPLLSYWAFGNMNYVYSFVILSVVVAVGIYTEGKLAILKGKRQLQMLAKASIYAAFFGLLVTVPLFFLLNENGIIPAILVSSLVAFFFSNYFVKKLRLEKTTYNMSFYQVMIESKTIIMMGIALMYVAFLSALSDLLFTFYISHNGEITDLGCYQAGIVIVTGYFGIVLTAMGTDYYPRISAIHEDSIKLEKELNTQSEIGLLIMFPMVVLFLFFSSFLIEVLYSAEFYQTIQYTDYAILGMIIIICSNSLGIILLAKQKKDIFIISSTVQRIIGFIIGMVLFNRLGIKGLGIGYLTMAFIHLIAMSIIMKVNYNVRLSNKTIFLLVVIFFISVLTLVDRNYTDQTIKYSLGLLLILFSFLFSFFSLKTRMNLQLKKIFTRK